MRSSGHGTLPLGEGESERAHPEAKILYISGYSDKAIVHQSVLGAGTAFLQKPFTAEALLHKIRELLEGRVREAA